MFKGEIIGLIGFFGVGKFILIKIMFGMEKVDKGIVFVFDI